MPGMTPNAVEFRRSSPVDAVTVNARRRVAAWKWSGRHPTGHLPNTEVGERAGARLVDRNHERSSKHVVDCSAHRVRTLPRCQWHGWGRRKHAQRGNELDGDGAVWDAVDGDRIAPVIPDRDLRLDGERSVCSGDGVDLAEKKRVARHRVEHLEGARGGIELGALEDQLVGIERDVQPEVCEADVPRVGEHCRSVSAR
eukprot:1044036-Rhodomonas_salina.1